MEYIPVQDHPNLVRDLNSNAILNTDKESLRRSRAARRSMASKDERINSLEAKVELLEKLIKEKLGI